MRRERRRRVMRWMELLSWSRCQEQNREGEGRESESGKRG
jgi:hypothetical protein